MTRHEEDSRPYVWTLGEKCGVWQKGKHASYFSTFFFFSFCSPGNAIITIYYFDIIFSLCTQIKASSHVAGRALDLCLFISTCVLKQPHVGLILLRQRGWITNPYKLHQLRFHKYFMTLYSTYFSINRMLIIMNVI